MTISDNTIANILNGEKWKAFPLRSGTRQGYPPASRLLNTVLEVLARAIRQEKETKGTQIRREAKLSLCENDMVLDIENPKDATKKTVTTKTFSKVAVYKII